MKRINGLHKRNVLKGDWGVSKGEESTFELFWFQQNITEREKIYWIIVRLKTEVKIIKELKTLWRKKERKKEWIKRERKHIGNDRNREKVKKMMT
jgi:hypothetical protein